MYLFRKPLLPSHYFLWFEPPDESGDEVLRIVSERRSLKLKGHSFREFYNSVTPLLDGKHTMEEICEKTADRFDAADLDAALRLLASQGIVVEGQTENDGEAPLIDSASIRLTPQLNYFHETYEGGRSLQHKLTGAQITILGTGTVGAHVALGLASAGVGKVVVVDSQAITPTDLYFVPFLSTSNIGRNRAEIIVERIANFAPDINAVAVSTPITSEEDIWRTVEGSNYVVCCLDSGQINLIYKLNRVCLDRGLRWITSSLEGVEVVVGPAFEPNRGPCFMCYRMRAVACAANPVSSFAMEQYLDRKKTDFGNRRENLVFGAGIVANLLGVEVLNALTQGSDFGLWGKLLAINLSEMSMRKHTVLRKPMCPACMTNDAAKEKDVE